MLDYCCKCPLINVGFNLKKNSQKKCKALINLIQPTFILDYMGYRFYIYEAF